jgi:hypothetical protein
MEQGCGGLVQQIIPWFVLVGGTVFALAFVVGVLLTMFFDGRVYRQALQNLPVALGIPCSVLVSLCLVIFVKTTSGPIELKGLGFELKGASGPLALWVVCFLAMIIAIKGLWRWHPSDSSDGITRDRDRSP